MMQLLLNALVSSAEILLVAVSFHLIFRTVRFFHLAHGAVYVVGAYTAYVALGGMIKGDVGSSSAIAPLWSCVVAMIIAAAVGGGLGASMDLLIYRPLRKRRASALVLLLASFGALTAIQNIVALIFGSRQVSWRTGIIEEGYPLAGAHVTPVQLMIILSAIILLVITLSGCNKVPHDKKWGIYEFDLDTKEISLVYSSSSKFSTLRLNCLGDTFVFSQKIGGDSNENEEICTIKIDVSDFKRLTNNDIWDLYPAWSPDGSRIAFLSLRENDLDIYIMNNNGTDIHKFYDSGYNDGDIHWMKNVIVFTSNNSIWKINENGTKLEKITKGFRKFQVNLQGLKIIPSESYVRVIGIAVKNSENLKSLIKRRKN